MAYPIKVQTSSAKTGRMRLSISEHLHWTSTGCVNGIDKSLLKYLDRFVNVPSRPWASWQLHSTLPKRHTYPKYLVSSTGYRLRKSVNLVRRIFSYAQKKEKAHQGHIVLSTNCGNVNRHYIYFSGHIKAVLYLILKHMRVGTVTKPLHQKYNGSRHHFLKNIMSHLMHETFVP